MGENRIVDGADVKKIESPCGCAAVCESGVHLGASFYFCAIHAMGSEAVVYDLVVTTVHPAFAWDYTRRTRGEET